MNQKEEYIKMGLELMPSGRINNHKWYKRKYGLSSTKDFTWKHSIGKKAGKYCKGFHTCCGSKKAYYHHVGCVHRRDISEDDDYSDLKKI